MLSSERHRPKVLMSAYACSPEHGSEPGVGWNVAVQMARRCDVWLICEELEFGDVIRRHIDQHGAVPGLRFVYLPLGPIAQRLQRIPNGFYPSYDLWQRDAYRVAKELHEQVGFDLVHQVNLCTFRAPGYLWKLGVPFVWGPFGGTQNVPPRFLMTEGLVHAIPEAVRSLVNEWQLRYSHKVRQAARAASMVLAANSTGQADFARAHGVTPRLQLETGLLPRKTERHTKLAHEGLHLLWSGEFFPRKGLSVMLRSLAKADANRRERGEGPFPFRLRIMGRGRAERRYQAMAKRLGLDDRIEWLGWLPHKEALAQYPWADALVFTSLRDTSGNVVLEALAADVPVICLDHQGVHDMVDDESGIKVPVESPAQAVADLARVYEALLADPARLQQLTRGASIRATCYDWDHQGDRLWDIYQEVLGQQAGDAPADPAASTQLAGATPS